MAAASPEQVIEGEDILGTLCDPPFILFYLFQIPSVESLVEAAKTLFRWKQPGENRPHLKLFRDTFNAEADVGGAAPGRVNLIGDPLFNVNTEKCMFQASTRTTMRVLSSRWLYPWSLLWWGGRWPGGSAGSQENRSHSNVEEVMITLAGWGQLASTLRLLRCLEQS